jgi:hypothetical protein
MATEYLGELNVLIHVDSCRFDFASCFARLRRSWSCWRSRASAIGKWRLPVTLWAFPSWRCIPTDLGIVRLQTPPLPLMNPKPPDGPRSPSGAAFPALTETPRKACRGTRSKVISTDTYLATRHCSRSPGIQAPTTASYESTFAEKRVFQEAVQAARNFSLLFQAKRMPAGGGHGSNS